MAQTAEERIAALEAENAKLQAAVAAKVRIRMKVADKGGLSVYGLGRFPVTLYKSQWHSLLALAPQIKAFLVEHDGDLKDKD